MSSLKIVSWNIAGGYPINSLDHFDYSDENIGYFIQELKKLDPDIVCLQETHTSYDEKRVIALEIAKALGMTYTFNSPASPSHINSGYMLGNAIISRPRFSKEKLIWYPDPEMELFFKDGKKAITHRKNLQTVVMDNFYIGNTQMLPITLFSFAYDDGKEGSNFAKQINQVMEDIKTPIIWCGDFNFNNPKEIYSSIQELNLTDALPDNPTRPSKDGAKKTPDHIYYSKEFKLVKSEVIQTNTDHYLCFAEFEY